MRALRENVWEFGVSMVALLGVGATGITAANAGGFAIREQSAYYQGMSFAGAGTGDTLSSMYWNSAAAAAAPGINSESHVSIILSDTEITADPFPGVIFEGVNDQSGDLADPAFVAASYANYQLNDRLYFGLAMNSGFGLITKPDNTDWIGSAIAITSDVFSINVNPTVAYKITPDLTIGAGVQLEYINIRLNNGPSTALPVGRSAELDDIGVGATAGLSWTPASGTTIGVGYRSAVSFDLEGDYFAPQVIAGPASAELTLPDMVTVGLRQSLTDRIDLLAGFEWTNWSRVGSIPVTVDLGGISVSPETLRLNYEDGYFYSLGAEYAYSPSTTLRVGVAYEESPINDLERNVLLPDNDRIWLSVGASHQISENIKIDLGYTHIFVDDASICRDLGNGAEPCAPTTVVALQAESESSVDIISASFKYKWGDAEDALEPLK